MSQLAAVTGIHTIVTADDTVAFLLAASPALAKARFEIGATRQTAETYYMDEIGHYIYAGDTALGAGQMRNRRYVAYYRVSTAKQGHSGLGLEAQREGVTRYLNGDGWEVITEFTEVESGRRADRPQLEKALAAARLHRCPLVVAKVDRLTRSVSFLSRLLEAGVDVRFADLPAIEGPTGRFLLQQMAAVAELEAGLISSRTKAALAAAKARGKVLGGNRGAVLSEHARAIGRAIQVKRASERAADLRPMIRDLQQSGAATLRAIARALTERGIPTARSGRHWTATQVARVLERQQ